MSREDKLALLNEACYFQLNGLIELLGEHPAVEDLALKQYLVKPESPATVVQAVV